jgi:hypothetical protein
LPPKLGEDRMPPKMGKRWIHREVETMKEAVASDREARSDGDSKQQWKTAIY